MEFAAFSDQAVSLDNSGNIGSVTAGTYAGGRLIVDSSTSYNAASSGIVWVGTSGNDTPIGTSGTDFFMLGNGNDLPSGLAGDDYIFGGSGNDWIQGGDGSDYVDGGEGGDGVSYLGSNVGVTVNLQTGVVSGGDATGDILVSIENAAGSNIVDTIIGSSGNNVIEGWDGADILDGAGGTDIVSYWNSNAAVQVNLSLSTAQSGGHAAGDILSNFENLTGSSFNDTLTGDSNDNLIEGLGGADTINGGAGIDTVTYWNSNAAVFVQLGAATQSGGHAEGDVLSSIENLDGSDGYGDILIGDSGDNRLRGFGGDDIFFGRNGNDTIEGGIGNDIALLTGNRSAYTLTWDAGNSRYNVVGTDGSDTVSGVEFLVFDDDVLTLDNIGGWTTTAAGTYAGGRLIVGTSGNDTVTLSNVGVVYAGLGGTDTITGGTGADFLWGGAANDVLEGGGGRDYINAA